MEAPGRENGDDPIKRLVNWKHVFHQRVLAPDISHDVTRNDFSSC